MKSSRSVHFDKSKGRYGQILTSPVEVPLESRTPMGRRASVHWQHPEIPTTITEGHVLEVENSPTSSSQSSQSECHTCDGRESESDNSPCVDSVLISRDRSQSLPASTRPKFRLLRDKNWFQRWEFFYTVWKEFLSLCQFEWKRC